MTSGSSRDGGLLRAGVLTLGGRVGNFTLSIIAAIVLARALGPTGRGLYALAILGPSVFVLLANFGIGYSLVYYLARRTFDINQVIGQVLSLSLLLGVGATAALLAITYLLGPVVLPGVPFYLVLIAGAAIPLSLFFYFCLAFFQGIERFDAFNSLYLVNGGGQVLFLMALFLNPGNVTVAVGAWALSTVPTAVLGLYLLSRHGRLNLRFDTRIAGQLIRFGLVGYVSYVTNYLNFRLDMLLVNIFKNATQVGLYAVAVSLAETIWYVSTSAATVLAPKVAAGAPADADQTTARVSRTVLAASVVGAALLAIAAPLIIEFVLGARFLPSVVAVWLLLPGVITLSVARVLSSYLLGRNRQQVDLVASLVGLIVTLGLDLVLIPRYGFAGAAVASSIAYTATLAVSLSWVVRNSTMSVWDLLLPRPSDFRFGAGRLQSLLGRR